jgi:hypothetical protein
MLIRRANKYCAEPMPLQQQELAAPLARAGSSITRRAKSGTVPGDRPAMPVMYASGAKDQDKRGNQREGYIRRRLADVPFRPSPSRTAENVW